VERDLLRRDRGDERLERIGRERGPEACEADDERGDPLLSGCPGRERDEVELESEEPADDRLGLRVERLDLDGTAFRSGDPQLAAADRAIERAVLPDRRAVETERTEACRRQLEGERLRSREQQV
jgi:hypothetical protein